MYVDIIVGTMLGATEYVADRLAEHLDELKIDYTIHLTPSINELTLGSFWLVCTSTHGAGDLPDNIKTFAKQISHSTLEGQPFAVVGLGDSSYDTFCQGAKYLETCLKEQGATLIEQPKHIDVLAHPVPEDEAIEWFKTWASQVLV